MPKSAVRRWNFLTLGYPAAITFGAVGFGLSAVQAGAIVTACTLLIWLKQPMRIDCRQETIVFRVLPLWAAGVVIPAAEVAVEVRRGRIRFRASARRLPVFRTLAWHRDPIDLGLPKFLAALRSAGCSVDEDN